MIDEEMDKVAAASRRWSEEETQSRDGSATVQRADQSRDGSATLGYFDPDASIEFLSGDLPHWRQEGVTYFVTFRLADALPQEKLETWRLERDLWMKQHPEPHGLADRTEYFRLFPRRMQQWIDAGAGSCVLEIESARKIVADALMHFTVVAASRRGELPRYELDEWVVAPNHVHAIVTPLEGFELSAILHSWKSYTAHELLKVPEVQERRKTAAGRRCHNVVWQKETFDHIVRSPASLERFRAYIRGHR